MNTSQQNFTCHRCFRISARFTLKIIRTGALQYFNKALASASETRNKSSEAGIMADIGRACIKKKKYGDANHYLQESLTLSRKLGLKRVSRHVYYALVDLRLREGKTTEAFNYMRAYYDVRDSLLNGSKTRQIVELETRFEKEKQEQRIQLLEQEKTIQQLWTNVLIVGSVLLVITIVIIYRLQKLRAAKARQLLEPRLPARRDRPGHGARGPGSSSSGAARWRRPFGAQPRIGAWETASTSAEA